MYRHGDIMGLKSLMKLIFLFPSFYAFTCYFWRIHVSSLRRIFRNRRKVRMFPQKLFPLNMVRSNWIEMIFEAWNAIDFTPNGMSNEHWSSMKKEFIILCYSMSDRYLRNKSRSFYQMKVFQVKKTASIMVLAYKIQSNLWLIIVGCRKLFIRHCYIAITLF